jgi:biopolymer transport protein ExbD
MSSGNGKKITIGKPGYRMQPKYDLHFLRKKRGYHSKQSAVPELPLVSLIDMFTILVIFLLMNFSTEGESFFIPKGLTLPLATNGKPLKTAPLLSLNDREIILETEKRPGVQALNIKASMNGDLNEIITGLESLKKEMSTNLAKDEKFKGQINIQADENLNLDMVKKVMKICVQNGWGAINIAVRNGK